MRIALVNNKLTVKESNVIHENHRSDKLTFQHYPENMRLKEDETIEVRKRIACGGCKALIKHDLMKNRDSPVPLKAIHNLQTRDRAERQGLTPDNELERLLETMNEIPDAIAHVIRNEENELIGKYSIAHRINLEQVQIDTISGIYFQDQRMVNAFDKYPEVFFFDATNNLNSRKMPLFIQSCVDGNGDTEIVNLFICKGESRESIGSMIDIFREYNPASERTKVIIGDKDFADRSVYNEKFPDAVLQICLFHVLKTFNREITPLKRSITKNQRYASLEIIQKIVYSPTEEEYETLYQELLDLDLPEVTSYFNENWHVIRNEWTLHGRNRHANYLNATNNRLESLNSKLKMLGSRYSNLLTCFENLSISISVLTSERDIKSVRREMKVRRVRFTDPVLDR